MIWTLPLVPALAGLAIWAMGDRPGRVLPGAAAFFAAAATLLLAIMLPEGAAPLHWAPGLELRAGLPPMARAVAFTVAGVGMAVLLYAAAQEAATGLGRLLGIMLIFVGGMQMVVIADDLLALLIGWEVMGACSWALIGHRWREGAPMRSANYAFVMTRAGDIGLFVALFAVFAGTGSTSYAALGQLEGGLLGITAWGLLVAAASKSGQLPFAPWLFRAMDGPAAVSALLHSAAMVAAGVYLLARLGPDLAAAPGFGPGALAVGLATAVAGGVVAIRQTHAKKLLAGSTSAQMGLMIAAVGAGFPGVAILHLVVHAAFKAALFIAAGIAHHATGSHDLRDMALGRAMPRIALLLLPAALSLAAVPPLAGGWSKEEILKALEAAGPVASALGVFAGGLSAAYAARFAILAFGPGREERLPVPAAALAALLLLGAATLALSLLRVPTVSEAALDWLGAAAPRGSTGWLIASLAAVGAGLMAGWAGARAPSEPPQQEWLGLSALVDAAIVSPFERMSRHAARLDDAVIDGMGAPGRDDVPLGRGVLALAVRGATGTASLAARFDDAWIDGQRVTPLGRLTPGHAPRPAPGGGAIALLTRATAALARIAGRGGEAISDLIPEGSGRVAGLVGADLRRVQTGMAHHYYALLLAGTFAGALFLIFGG